MPGTDFCILAIDPGSASTKLAVYRNDQPIWIRNLEHGEGELAAFRRRPILDQLFFRQSAMEAALTEAGYPLEAFHAVAGRGGLMRPVCSGTYRVNEEMLDDLRRAPYGEHAANLGAFLALAFAQASCAAAFVVDPVSVDEWTEVAHISGSALAPRRCLSHALNTKSVARRFARDRGVAYADLRLIVAHLGSGISISAHAGGRMIDGNLAGQEGPFSTERCGGLQLLKVLELCFSGAYTQRALEDALIRDGGIYSYLGTRDLREVERRMACADPGATLIFEAMVDQIAKQIGAMAAVLDGRVDAILLTGGMAFSEKLASRLRERVAWLAPVALYPGEHELQALAEGALRVLRGEETARELGPAVTLTHAV